MTAIGLTDRTPDKPGPGPIPQAVLRNLDLAVMKRIESLLPGEHLVDSGYPSAELIIHAARVFGITLVSPVLLDTSAQARAGAGYDKAAFAFDFDARQATCPQGIASSTWTPCRQRHEEAIVVSWPATACLPCPARQLCTSRRRRQITIRPRELHEALASARTQQTSAVEGTL